MSLISIKFQFGNVFHALNQDTFFLVFGSSY